MPTLFIADLHLSDDTPDLNALFAQFLREQQGKADALYIMGDLFEAWTGDDDDSQTAQAVAAQIRQFSQFAPVYFIAGNRDFLVGKHYAKRANMTLLPENYPLQLHGKTLLLTHGDEMCTDDVDYQRYRKIIRNPWLQKLLLLLPFKKRRQIAANIRANSRAKKQSGQTYAISDVTEQGIQAALTRFPQTDILIHGHTHRPAIHQHLHQQKTIIRYVLPDWHAGKGGYLAIDEHNIQLFRLPENTTMAK